MKRTTAFGVFGTAVWAASVAALCLLRWTELTALPLNSIGDFLAGAVAPLAFFWLVLGYLQQGEELRLNTEALKAQQEELRRQVQETAALAKNAERQASAAELVATETRREAERQAELRRIQAQPLFVPNGGSGKSEHRQISVVNQGAPVRELRTECSAGFNMSFSPSDFVATGQTTQLIIVGEYRAPFEFSVYYKDALNREEKQLLYMYGPFSFRNAA